MKRKKELATYQVRLYEKEGAILARLAFRKNTTIAEVIRLLIKANVPVPPKQSS
jgi:hypothetical protein